MKVGIIGSGDVGKAIGRGLVTLGHEVTIGSRDPAKLRDWAQKTSKNASAGSFAEAAAFGELIVLSTLWSGTENALKLAGHGNLRGKILIDTTNPLDFSSMPPTLSVAGKDSGGPIDMSRYLEPLAMVWIVTWARTQSGNHGFKLLRK